MEILTRKTSPLEVYNMVLAQAKTYRRRVNELIKFGSTGPEVDKYRALVKELYDVAQNLEMALGAINGTETDTKCTVRCWEAETQDCHCSCGGDMHGIKRKIKAASLFTFAKA